MQSILRKFLPTTGATPVIQSHPSVAECEQTDSSPGFSQKTKSIPSIDLGEAGRLIHPIAIGHRVLYVWDFNSDNTHCYKDAISLEQFSQKFAHNDELGTLKNIVSIHARRLKIPSIEDFWTIFKHHGRPANWSAMASYWTTEKSSTSFARFHIWDGFVNYFPSESKHFVAAELLEAS